MSETLLPPIPKGFERAPPNEILTSQHMWAYKNATCWLRTRYSGEKQPANNVYIRPVTPEQA